MKGSQVAAMTPSMIMALLRQRYSERADILTDLELAFRLGHEFGIERVADFADDCVQRGSDIADDLAYRIRRLQLVPIQVANGIKKES